MKKIWIIAAAVIMLLAVAVGCGGTSASPHEDEFGRFIRVEAEYVGSGALCAIVFADSETGVMYMHTYVGDAGGLTVMVDASGNPLIWTGER